MKRLALPAVAIAALLAGCSSGDGSASDPYSTGSDATVGGKDVEVSSISVDGQTIRVELDGDDLASVTVGASAGSVEALEGLCPGDDVDAGTRCITLPADADAAKATVFVQSSDSDASLDRSYYRVGD